MNVLLIGPPGSGKGTQGERLAAERGWAHIATGDLLRAEVTAGTDLGRRVAEIMQRGDLVGDELMIELVLPKVREAADTGGYVLDGFPRSVTQAKQAHELISTTNARPDIVLYLDVSHDELIRRILERAGVEGRSDDNAETVANRLKVFDEATRPLVDFYRDRGLLAAIDGAHSPDEVAAAINAAIDQVAAEL